MRLILPNGHHRKKGQFLAYLPFIAKTWERSAKFLKEDEAPYWSKTNALPYDAKEDISQAIDYLLKYNRPNEAIRCLDYMIHEKMPFDTQQAVRALLQLLQIPGGEQKLQAYDITEVIKAIQDKPDANPEDLAKIEFAYLPLLDRFHDASPILLERCLADDPAFFCKIIHMVFKSKKKDASVEEYSEKQKEIAHNAFQLLYNWKTPPGSRKDGTFDGEALNSWLKGVKASCIKSGHYEIALEMVGHVLAHSPHDPSGFWLDHSVAKVLNAKDAKELRIGFRLELFNSPGYMQ